MAAPYFSKGASLAICHRPSDYNFMGALSGTFIIVTKLHSAVSYMNSLIFSAHLS
jgi:hypothetical protein